MNFFKSILLDDPDPEKPQDSKPNPSEDESDHSISHENPTTIPNPDSTSDSESNDTGGGGGWNFGGFMKTLATRSESVLETYRRDLQEFGTGLKKETVIFREVASRAVKELPASIEVGASVAHGALDGVIKSTTEIISHGKETLLASSDLESDTPETSGLVSGGSGRYSRFDAQLSAIQNDLNTFCEEPEDLEEYNRWKSGFVLEEQTEEVENLIGENGALESVYNRVVPNVVDDQTFWFRYFYRVYKLKQQESLRANLVKRAISIDDEEELSWDVDDDDYEEETITKPEGVGILDKKEETVTKPEGVGILEKKEETVTKPEGVCVSEKKESGDINPSSTGEQPIIRDSHDATSGVADTKLVDESLQHDVQKENTTETSGQSDLGDEKANLEGEKHVKESEDGIVKEDEKAVTSEVKDDSNSSTKDGNTSNISSKPAVSEEEEELGWDEIEDIGSDDQKKATSISSSGKQNTVDARKRLSAAEDDEDLSWDIEDDD